MATTKIFWQNENKADTDTIKEEGYIFASENKDYDKKSARMFIECPHCSGDMKLTPVSNYIETELFLCQNKNCSLALSKGSIKIKKAHKTARCSRNIKQLSCFLI